MNTFQKPVLYVLKDYGRFLFNGQTGQTRISLSVLMEDLVQASRKSRENGSPSNLIQIFGLD
jgi:hypothetical protein